MSKKPSDLLRESAIPFDRACMMVKELERENELMRMTLKNVTNAMIHSKQKLMTPVEKEILDALKKLRFNEVYL